jgi:glycosyltransferase involved in cell wall biosynthesis
LKTVIPRLLFVLNDAAYFLSHRLPIAQAARAGGFKVHVAAPESEKTADVRAHGLVWHALPLTRSGTNPFTEMATLWALIRLFRRIRPDIVHLVTVKPVVYGGIAARIAKVPAVAAAVPGLGFVFSHQGFKADALRLLLSLLYRMALGHPRLRAIFQNPVDARRIARLASLPAERICLIRGAGVDLANYAFTPLPKNDEIALVVLPARLLRSKGVLEFVEAARQLRADGVKARFALAGVPDAGNPDSVTHEAIEAWVKEGVIEYWGYRDDMPLVMARSSLVVLPSYAEGLPKALIEAQACGRAVVTSDAPGCRDAITPGVTGLLTPPRDAKALADAIKTLLSDRERLQAMGKAARALAEEAFDVRQVVAQHMKIYQSLASEEAAA